MNVMMTWSDVAIRLAVAVIVGAVIGFDREEKGHVAGLRTTILVCLAATGAMIEANMTLAVLGKTPGSFTIMDALRFPLGILSGIGFIGAGAIVRRDKLVTGLTTAATLWLVTVIGLVIGGGYIALGIAITIIAVAVLAGLKWIEPQMQREHQSNLTIQVSPAGPSNEDLRGTILAMGYRIASTALTQATDRSLRYRVSWQSTEGADRIPLLVEQLAGRDGIVSVNWEPVQRGQSSY